MVDKAQPVTGDQDHRRWVVAAITLAANLGSFLYLVLVARSAAPAIFGGLAALAGIALVFEVPASALQVVVGRSVSDRAGPAPRESLGQPGQGGGSQRGADVPAGPMLVDATAWGAGVCAVLLALSPLIERFLHLPTVTSALLLGAYALPVGISVVPKGVLAGQGRLSLLGAGLLAGIAVRLVVGVTLVRRGGGVEGAFVAMVWGEVVTAAIVLLGLKQLLAPPPVPSSLQRRPDAAAGTQASETGRAEAGSRVRWGDAKLPVVAFTGYWILTAVDVVLARHWLSLDESGVYAAAATVAEIALLAPAAVAAITFPRLVGGEVPRLIGPGTDSRPNQRLMFALGSATVAVTGFAAAVAVSLLASWTVRELFGSGYAGAQSVVGLLSFSAALLGLVTVLLHYHLNRGGRLSPALCWPGIVVAVVGTAIWHKSMTEIATVMVVSTATVCAAMLLVAILHAEGSRQGLVERANLALLDADLDLTVVVPYYNPGKLLVPTMERLLSVLDNSEATYEVIAVSDGSTDGSDRQLDAALSERSQLTNLVFVENQGKGAALRIGLAKGRGRYLGFIDADGDLDPILLDSFQTMVRLYSPDIILGSKRHPLSEVEYPLLRRIYSWGYQQVVRAGFRLNIKDTQTGIKLVRRDVLAAVLPRMLEKRFAFDLELFVIARRLGYKRFLEAPIRLRHQFTSTVSWKSVYRSLIDTMAIWYRLRVLHYYDGDQGPATPGSEGLRIDPFMLRGGAGVGAGSAGVTTPLRGAAASEPSPSHAGAGGQGSTESAVPASGDI
ncbi:MAG TPA: glycosyltransferase [Acidimicrobiales bacterium]|nr:glycosyltransferase [Acidimicrobiales bacterium]